MEWCNICNRCPFVRSNILKLCQLTNTIFVRVPVDEVFESNFACDVQGIHSASPLSHFRFVDTLAYYSIVDI